MLFYDAMVLKVVLVSSVNNTCEKVAMAIENGGSVGIKEYIIGRKIKGKKVQAPI